MRDWDCERAQGVKKPAAQGIAAAVRFPTPGIAERAAALRYAAIFLILKKVREQIAKKVRPFEV
jgi:hypothetical protein